MILEFPRSGVLLERTKLSYINLPGLLSDGKRDRAARVCGYVNIALGEHCYLVFLRGGEPFHAGLLAPAERGPQPLAEVLRRIAAEIERGEIGQIGYYAAPESQLRAMVATLAAELAPATLGWNGAEPERLFAALRQSGFDGVAELRCGGRVHYVEFERGVYRGGHFTDRPGDVAVGEFVRSICSGAVAPCRISLFSPLQALPVQAPPALVEMYRALVRDVAHEAEAGLGREEVLALLERSRGSVAAAAPVLGQMRVDASGRIEGDPITEAGALTAAVAAWLTEFLGAVGERAPVDAAGAVARHTRDGRFVLAEHGFFDRLPWPVGV